MPVRRSNARQRLGFERAAATAALPGGAAVTMVGNADGCAVDVGRRLVAGQGTDIDIRPVRTVLIGVFGGLVVGLTSVANADFVRSHRDLQR
mgnify:CR=1 FL=1